MKITVWISLWDWFIAIFILIFFWFSWTLIQSIGPNFQIIYQISSNNFGYRTQTKLIQWWWKKDQSNALPLTLQVSIKMAHSWFFTFQNAWMGTHFTAFCLYLNNFVHWQFSNPSHSPSFEQILNKLQDNFGLDAKFVWSKTQCAKVESKYNTLLILKVFSSQFSLRDVWMRRKIRLGLVLKRPSVLVG